MYQETLELNKEEINLALQSGDENLVADAIISACKFINDYDYVIDICKKFGFSENDTIKLNVLSGLSLIAYNHKKMDTKLAFKIIDFIIQNGGKELRNFAKTIRKDIKHYSNLYKFS